MADLKKLVLLCTLTMLALTGASFAQQSLGAATAADQVQNDTSPALSDLVSAVGAPDTFSGDMNGDGPSNPYPVTLGANRAPGVPQGIQTQNLPLAQATQTGNFPGLAIFAGGAGGFIPPDTVGAVGNGQFVQAVNSAFGVFDKNTGALLAPAAPTRTLWSGFGGDCETHNNGDAIVQFDKLASRWVISQFAINNGGPFYECVAVSTTPNALGTYNRYAFPYGTDFPDYPKVGAWPNAYYATYNTFNAAGNAYLGAKICALNRSAMLAGAPANMLCFGNLPQYYSILPVDFDGTVPPAAGADGLLLEQDSTINPSTILHFFNIHPDFVTPANTTGFVRNITVPIFDQPCPNASRGACVPQPATATVLESLQFHLMHRAAWRIAGGRESLMASATTAVGNHAGIRWYELQNPSTLSPVVFQASTYSPDAKWRWMPSIAMDKMGNIAVAYSVSDGVSTRPSIAMGGRLRSELRNVLEPEVTLWNGTGSQNGAYQRWGDYSAMTVDPADDCTFYFTTEYLAADHPYMWSTRISKFKFPNCH